MNNESVANRTTRCAAAPRQVDRGVARPATPASAASGPPELAGAQADSSRHHPAVGSESVFNPCFIRGSIPNIFRFASEGRGGAGVLTAIAVTALASPDQTSTSLPPPESRA